MDAGRGLSPPARNYTDPGARGAQYATRAPVSSTCACSSGHRPVRAIAPCLTVIRVGRLDHLLGSVFGCRDQTDHIA